MKLLLKANVWVSGIENFELERSQEQTESILTEIEVLLLKKIFYQMR